MKWPYFLFIFFLLSCTSLVTRDPAEISGERHVVFDIDWTIVSEIKTISPDILKNKRVIEVQGKHYFINEGLEEFIGDILSRPKMKISFYSGGLATRNKELLLKIKLKNGQSLHEIAYKILSNEDLVPVVDIPKTARFADRFKKDLSKVSKNMEDLIMFDDTENFFLENGKSQRSHVFFIGKAFEFFENFSDTAGISGEYVPRTYDEWLLNKKKLSILHAVFNEAYEESTDSGITFSEAMKNREELLNLKDHQWNSYSNNFYNKNQRIKKPKVLQKEMDCTQLSKLFLVI